MRILVENTTFPVSDSAENHPFPSCYLYRLHQPFCTSHHHIAYVAQMGAAKMYGTDALMWFCFQSQYRLLIYANSNPHMLVQRSLRCAREAYTAYIHVVRDYISTFFNCMFQYSTIYVYVTNELIRTQLFSMWQTKLQHNNRQKVRPTQGR